MVTPGERRPRANFHQAEARRFRLRFRRTGRAAFESHLDLVRLVPRVFRRAELSMFYSQGFHPKPEMVFGPALSLGVATLDDYVDVKLACDADPDALPALLQPGAPDGLRFLSAARLGPNDPGISKVVDATEYVAAVPWSWLRAQGIAHLDDAHAHVDARRATPLSVLRRIEGLGKRIDVTAHLEALTVGDGADALDDAGYAGELLALRFRTRMFATGAVKAAEVVEALFGPECPSRFVRTAMGRARDGEIVSPMNLEALRAAKPVPHEATEATDASAAGA